MSAISKRVGGLDVSGIRRVFDMAGRMEDPINFSIGQPDFRVPERVKEACCRAVSEDQNSYTPTQGAAELTRALTEDCRRRKLAFEDLIVTSGVSGGLFLAFSALLDPGDEVVIPDPYFLMYKQLGRFLGARVTFVDTYPDFRVTAERLEPHLKPGTKLLVLNIPGNPTGVGLSAEEWRDLADLLRRHPGITVISDEVYRLFHYEEEYPSLASMRENVITLDGFSKSHSLTGWRVGWAAGPKDIIQQMAKLQQFTFVCSPAPAQRAAVVALETGMEAERRLYQAKRDQIYEALRRSYEVARPQGTFYMFPKVPSGYGGGEEFAQKALEKKLLVIPGKVFSERDTHFRLSFATGERNLARGIRALDELARG